jgi:hypothetical protein
MALVPLAFSLALQAASAAPAPAAQLPSGAPPAVATRMVVPGQHYGVGGLRRFIFGKHYRSLWTAPLPAEVLDLSAFSAGLTPRRKSGGRQTLGLKFQGADGRRWKFRSLDKDPTAVLPPELRDTFVDAIVQDQISAANPAAPLVVDALAEAAGIPYVPHRLVVLPDDPALGEFRKEFAGVVGLLEQEIELKPPVTPGFERYSRFEDTDEMWARLDKHPEEKVDGRALLTARLFDVLLGDLDRHRDNWSWAKLRDAELWYPVPKDRDQAFAKYDGLLLTLLRPAHPELVDFDSSYPRIFGLTWTGRHVDRRHLSELEWSAWEEVTRTLRERLTDAVIDEAVRRLPEEHYKLGGPLLAARLKARRDSLPSAAKKYYALLAREVAVHGSDAGETVEVAPGEDGTVRVTVSGEGGEHFRRHFRPRETSEVRLYLKGGDDHVVRKPGTDDITIRMVGGSGNDVLDDTQSGHTRVYDSQGANRVLRGSGTHVDERPYTAPLDSLGMPLRDWGRTWMSMPMLSGGGDLGIYLGGRVSLVGYGFRKDPYSFKHTLRAGYATALTAFDAEYDGTFYRNNSRTFYQLVVKGSQIEVLRFYGLGNETPTADDEDFFRVEQNLLSIAPSVHFGGAKVDLQLGAIAQRTNTETPDDTFIGLTRPYGTGIFGQAGVFTRLTLGRRDVARTASGYVWAGGSYFPELWDVESGFGNLESQAAVFLSPGSRRVAEFGFRIGAKKVFGTFPFHESAFVGGADQVRGLRPQRFAGDASAFGSAEMHLRLARVTLLLPSEFGVLGFGDIGRVWVDGEDSTKWHQGWGAGLWLAPLKRSASLAVLWAHSEGEDRYYIQGGFGF